MSRLGPLLSPILIGRDELLDAADRRLADAAAGRGSFLLLAGEAGIGKSRLMAAIERRARAAGFRSADGQVAPQDRDVPAASLLDMARSMTRIEPFAELGHALLELVDVAASAQHAARRMLVHDAVDRIARAASDEPTMLWFDDLQWTDDLSLEILTELARAAADRRLLVVAAYRSDEVAPGSLLREWRSRLLTQRLADEARLAPLSLDETALMTSLLLATGLPAPTDVARAVHERTDGVPLHIEELLGALSDEERDDSRAIREAAVPDTLEDAILRRIGRLSPDAQTVARVGAVIGRCFVPEVLAGIMDVSPESLDGPLRELIDEQVLEPPGLRGLYDYRHQLLRDALYRSLPARDRRRLHARAAEFGRELEGASEIHASLHYERAGLREQAFRSAVHGAREAARLSSHREAVGLYGRAVDNMPDSLPAAEQALILQEYALEAAAIEQNDVVTRAAAAARERYLAAGDPVGAARTLIAPVAIARREAHPIEERRTLIEAARHEIASLPETAGATAIRGFLAIEAAHAALDAMDLGGAAAALDEADEAARRIDADEMRLDAASVRGMLDALSGQVAEGLDRIGAVALEARMRGFEDTGVTAYRNASVLAARLLDHRRAESWIDEGMRYADAIEQSHCSHVMASTGGLVAWEEGRWDDAVRRGQLALAERGCARGSGMARWPLGYAALGRGDLVEAREHLTYAVTFGERSGVPDFELAGLWGLAEAALVGGDADQSVDLTSRALDLALASGELGRFVPFAVTGARARIAAGRPADAARWADAAGGHLVPLGSAGAPAIAHARGLVAMSEGSLVAARGALEHAVRGWDALGRLWESSWARLDLAACLLRSNRRSDAAGLLADVRTRAQGLDSRPLLARVSQLEQQARGRVVDAEPWRPLTAREFEVARLIAEGRTNAEIANALDIAPKTVAAHVEHVLAKLGAARRTEIAAWVASIAPVVREVVVPPQGGRRERRGPSANGVDGEDEATAANRTLQTARR